MHKAHLITGFQICFTAALIGKLFVLWLTTPFMNTWTLQKAGLLGVITAIIVGALSRFWIRRPLIIITAAVVGLLCGATWIAYSFSDTVNGKIRDIICAVFESFQILWRAELLMLIILNATWFMTDYLLKRIKTRRTI